MAITFNSLYHIAGNFHWCKFLYIWPKGPPNKFSHVLISNLYSYARATRPRPCSWAWWSLSKFMNLFSVCFDRMTDLKSLGIYAAHAFGKILAAPIQSSPHVARSKFMQNIGSFKFYFHMQNACAKYMKISTMRKFPTTVLLKKFSLSNYSAPFTEWLKIV